MTVFPSGAMRARITSPRWKDTFLKAGGGNGPGRKNQTIAAPSARLRTEVAATAIQAGRAARSLMSGIAALGADFEEVPVNASRAKARSLADWKRCSGCFS